MRFRWAILTVAAAAALLGAATSARASFSYNETQQGNRVFFTATEESVPDCGGCLPVCPDGTILQGVTTGSYTYLTGALRPQTLDVALALQGIAESGGRSFQSSETITNPTTGASVVLRGAGMSGFFLLAPALRDFEYLQQYRFQGLNFSIQQNGANGTLTSSGRGVFTFDLPSGGESETPHLTHIIGTFEDIIVSLVC